MCGLPAELKRTISLNSMANGTTEGLLDICDRELGRKEKILSLISSKNLPAVTLEPIGSSIEAVETILNRFKTEERGKLTILEPVSTHPLIIKTVQSISNGEIGKPRIARIELINYVKKFTNYELSESTVYGFRMARLFFKGDRIATVYAMPVRTITSILYVIAAQFERGGVTHLVVGQSSTRSELRFGINGTGGMIAYQGSNRPASLRSGDGGTILSPDYFHLGGGLWDREVLSKTFHHFLYGSLEKTNEPEDILHYHRLLDAVRESASSGKPVQLSYPVTRRRREKSK
jgi:predicted dehydrogenase